MAMHSAWKGASNNTTLVVELDGPVDPERVRVALERLLDTCPWPASRLRRPFPWGRLHWIAGPRATLARPSVDHRTAATDADVQRLLETDLNAAIDPRRESPLRFLTIERAGSGGGILAMTWFHPLMDPRGGQHLLVRLADLDDGGTRLPHSGPSVAPVRDPRPLRERGREARKSLAYMRTLASLPPVSPGSRLRTAGPVRFRQRRFRERQRAARVTREIAWRLAVVGKAMAGLGRRYGLPDVPFLLPISVDLRPKGEPGAIFGNMLAFHFARFAPSETSNLSALARHLRRQMADAVRDGQIDANAVAMEFLHYRPLSMMLRALPWTGGGEVFSFNCADIGDFPPELQGCFGRRVLNAYHVPAVLPRPGIGVFFNRCAGWNNLVVSTVDGAVAEDDATRIIDAVGADMGWSAEC